MKYSKNRSNQCNSTESKRESTLHAVFDSVIEPMLIIDSEGTILDANRAFTAQFGKQVQECLNTNVYDLLPPKQAESRRIKVAEVLRTAKRVFFEDERSGIFYRYSLTPIADSDGNITQIYSRAQDITELKQLEKESTNQKIFSNALIEAIPGAFFVINAEGRYSEWNRYQRDIIGKPDSEIAYVHAIETVHPDYRALIVEKMELVMTNGVEASEQVKVLVQGGPEFRWFRLSGKRLIINDAPFIIGSGIDITEQKQAEEALLKNSEDRFRKLFQEHISVMLVIDPDNGAIIDANNAAVEFYGWSIDELRRMRIDQINLNSPEAFKRNIDKAKTLRQNTFQFQHRRADGSVRQVEIVSNPIVIDGNEVFYSIINDITERKQTEQALRKSESRFRKLFESHSAIMILLDPDTGNILDANPSAAAFYGWPIEELRQMQIQQITNVTADEAKINMAKAKTSAQNQFFFRHRRADGSIRDVEIFSNRIEIEGKDILYAIIHDITDRILAAEESDRLKTAFLANISHEIRTPMNGILGFAALLKDPQLSGEEQTEYIEFINQSSQRMLALINDLMDISRIDAKEATLHISATPLNDLLNELHGLFSLEARKKGLRLSCTKGVSDSESIIEIDSVKLNQVLSNLIQNALKFTVKGGIDFGYSRKNSSLEFYVIDSGIGIPETKKDRIFDRFHQVDNSLTRAYEGAGLGLSICKAYVEMMGGKLSVESSTGAGATFSFTLPYKPVNCTQTPSINTEELVNSAPDMTILIAEDDEISNILLKNILKGKNIIMLVAENGWEAVELIEHHPEIRLVLMDIKMPVMNGIEATKLIKQLRPDLPIIIQSAFTSSNEAENAITAGCDSIITKPVNKQELLGLIKTLVKK
jgi:PAS domain S-box-containing protein